MPDPPKDEKFIIGFLLGVLLWGAYLVYPKVSTIIFDFLVLTLLLIVSIKFKRKFVSIGMKVGILSPFAMFALAVGACNLMFK